MIANKLKQIWAEGKPTINGWCSIGNAFTAEIMAAQGYDFVTVDVQHGALDYSSLLPMLQAMRASGVVPMARVPWREPGIIMKALDAGAYGIICPMVNSAAEAAEFVQLHALSAAGQRSFGPTRVSFAAGADYGAEANDEMLAFAMIETAEGMANLASIAATPGLDGLYVGPADLTLGLAQGRLAPGFDREEPEMISALREIVAACKSNRICGAALWNAGIRCARHRVGFRHDDDLGELAAAGGGSGRKCDEVPSACWADRRQVRKRSLLMPHLLIAGAIHPAGLAVLESAKGFTHDYVKAVSEPSYAPLIGKADALVIRTQPLSAATIADAARLKIVSRHGVGYDSVDVAALNKHRIPLCIAGDTNSLSVAEHAMMLILACAKQAIRADRSVRGGAWGWRNRLEATEISGKRLLIVGYGRSGRHLARMAQGFAMEVRAFDPFVAERGWPDGTISPVLRWQMGSLGRTSFPSTCRVRNVRCSAPRNLPD